MNESFYKPVTSIDGIGPVTGDRYRARGIVTVSDLLADFIFRLTLGAKLTSPESVWFEVCLLLAVDGIDKDLADAIVREGLSVRSLDNLRSDTIRKKLGAQREQGHVTIVPELEEIQWWRVRAARISNCPIIAFKFLDLSSSRNNALFRVEIDDKVINTTQSGTAILYGVPSWKLVTKLYYGTSFVDFLDTRRHGHEFVRVRRAYAAPSLSYDREVTMLHGQLVLPKKHRVRFERPSLSELQEGSTYVARGGDGIQTVLVCDRYAVRGGFVVLKTIRPDDIPLEIGGRYKWNAHSFERIEDEHE